MSLLPPLVICTLIILFGSLTLLPLFANPPESSQNF